MRDNTTRRNILRKSGLAIAGATALSGTALAGDADPRDDSQEGGVPHENLHYSGNGAKLMPWGSQDQATAGQWLTFDVGWAFVPELDEGGREAALQWVEDTTDVITIDGEVFEDEDQHWIDPIPADEDWLGTHISWQFSTPPKEPGEYWFEWDCYKDGERVSDAFPYGQYITVTEENQNSN